MIECPPDKEPWRETPDGPMPLLVPEPQLEGWCKRLPRIWIEILPPDILLKGQALKPKDLIDAAKPSVRS